MSLKLIAGTGVRRSPLFFLEGARKRRRRRRSGSVADATPKPRKSVDGEHAVSTMWGQARTAD